MRTLLAAVVLATLATASAMAERKCWVSYAEFEDTVKHLDIDACPGNQPARDRGFCRLGVEGDSIILYVFEHTDGTPCMTRAERFRFADFVARHGVTYQAP
jgi:hypothetical protein